MGQLLRFAVIAVVALLLLRATRAAWSRRQLTVEVWRAIRPRHVLGALGLLVVVLVTAVGLLVLVPSTGLGLGALVGLEGNAIFAPIDSALEAPLTEPPVPVEGAPADAAAFPWRDLLLVTGFLALLVALFPTLAHAEEIAFRTGWEDRSLLGQAASALRFGLAHLIMLIPLAAALAVGVAGFAYGRIYLRAYRRAAVPVTVIPDWTPRVAEDPEGFTRLVMGPPKPVEVVDVAAARRAAVAEATVWHATFNTLVAVLVWLGYVLSL